MPDVGITNDVLAPREVERSVEDPECGAVCSFIGQTRKRSRGREITYLEYDTYRPLAEAELLRIAKEAEHRWKCAVAIRHRIGRVEIGDASVVIAVAAPHRAEAFEACRFCIDTLKQSVPIWKREVCADGTYWIEGEEAIKAAG